MKLVYTTGTYDVFHQGHYNFLKRSAEYGKLLVGVTSDKLVFQEKNKKTLVCQEKRMEIIKYLPFVDNVILHENSDKIEVHKELKFDICIIGSDWKGHHTYNSFEKALPNVEFVYLSYTDGISSTYIRNILNNKEKYHFKQIKLTKNEKKNIFCLDNINNYPKLERNCNLQHSNYRKINNKKYKGYNSWMELECLIQSQQSEYSVKMLFWYIDTDLWIITEKFGQPLKNINWISNKIVINLLKGIQSLHSIGIHHNDIHNMNILVDSDDNIKLCDYGWSNCKGDRNYASDYYYAIMMLYESGYRSYFLDNYNFSEFFNIKNGKLYDTLKKEVILLITTSYFNINKKLLNKHKKDVLNEINFITSGSNNMLKKSINKDNNITEKQITNLLYFINIIDQRIDTLFKICELAFHENNIKPYLAGGQLLGYIRNKKKIPWDHDIDFHITPQEFKIIQTKQFQSSVEKIGKKFNLKVFVKYSEKNLYKIYISNSIITEKIIQYAPFVDLIRDKHVYKNQNTYVHGSFKNYNNPKEINHINDIYPLKQIVLSNSIIWIPKNSLKLIERQYGTDVLNKYPIHGDPIFAQGTFINYNDNIIFVTISIIIIILIIFTIKYRKI